MTCTASPATVRFPASSGARLAWRDRRLIRYDIVPYRFSTCLVSHPRRRESWSSPPADRRKWIILSVLIISLVAIVLDNTVLNIALKTISEPRTGLGASQSQLEWAINSYTLVFAGLLFTFGVIGDRIGRKRMLMIGMAMFGLASLLCSYAQTPDQLIWARAAMGLGGAAVMPQTLSIITQVFEPKERPRAIGIWAAAVGMAIAVGPIVGGLLLDHFWWGSVFLINVPLTAVGVAAIWFLVPESRSPSPGRIDYLGVLLSIAGLVLVVYGIIQGGDTGSWLRADVLGPVAGGLAVLAFFGWHESRTEHPSLDVRLFRDPRLSSAAAAIGLVFFAMAGVYFFISFYMQNVRGYSPLHAGLLTIPLAAGQLLMSTRSAALVRRFGPKVGLRGGHAGARARAGRVSPAGHRHADVGAGGCVLRPGRGDGHGDADRDRGRDVRGAQEPRRRRVGDHQYLPAGGGRARGGRARLDPGHRVPAAPDAEPGRAAGRGQGPGHPVDRGHPGHRAASSAPAAPGCWPPRTAHSSAPCTSPR